MDVIRISDDRDLEYLEVGDPHGLPVVHLHGTPGTAGSAALLDEPARRQHVRLVAVSRPGYGASTTTAPGLLSVGRDVGELATALAIDGFGVLGISGGGPFALAVGAALPTRVHSVLIAAGSGPYDEVAPQALGEEDLRAMEQLVAGDVDDAVATLTAGVRRDFDALCRLPSAEFVTAFSAHTPPTEHYFDTRPEDRTTFYTDVHRALQRYDGFVRDNLSWSGRWDFELGDVVAPVVLSYGADDSMVAPVHGEWLETRLPSAELVVHPHAGHGEISFGLAEWLLSTMSRPAS